MTVRAVYVPRHGVITLHSTDDPSVWFAESTTVANRRYRILGVGSATSACICPAKKDCKHLLAAMRMSLEESMTEEIPEAVGQTTAVATRSNVTSIDARRALTGASQELAVAARGIVAGYKEHLYLAEQLYQTGLMPASVKTAQQAAIVMMKAAELGVPPMSALELFYIVGNKVAIQGQMIGALIERSGKGYIEVIESTEDKAIVTGHRAGRPPYTVEWTRGQAIKAGSKEMGGWSDKLVWKAIARIGRRMFADVLGGMDVGDGNGVVIDTTVEPIEGEYSATVDAPETEPPAPAPKVQMPWGAELKAALKDSPVTGHMLIAYFETDSAGLNDAIDYALASQFASPRALVSAVADWDAAGRPARTVPPAPAEDAPDAQEALFTEVEE